ncbi:hypothetical protein PanWU01x14_164850 [Parasponia andersonii]|uniref:Uncharacterized protein n=1 Tax=Parasponia andersonii TaxID=3476 RepID=A0A2P5CCG3_PARAD|nr:hypothetical protein PanWU01x14_164850 [Parasponia andersonii]
MPLLITEIHGHRKIFAAQNPSSLKELVNVLEIEEVSIFGPICGFPTFRTSNLLLLAIQDQASNSYPTCVIQMEYGMWRKSRKSLTNQSEA